ncbi:MAG TPA: hypothetical protein VFA43_00395 [Gemmatimonadaceae bacterium]|nr:hypothetical protein [Gemmatimonadaceae bacterium]
MKNITAAKKIVFHAVGDTGPRYGPQAIRAVSDAMEARIDLKSAGGGQPSFFYHLGDVVYLNGVSTLYPDQFYDPYKFYPRDIFAIAAKTMAIRTERRRPIRWRPSRHCKDYTAAVAGKKSRRGKSRRITE